MVRGFKAKAELKSLEIREDLGLKYYDPIDCFVLANSLKIPVYPVLKMEKIGFPKELINLICYEEGKKQFSATTVFTQSGHFIIYNQAHSTERTNSTLAHEAAHIILEHEFSSLKEMKKVSREFDKEKEDEANWMAGCLLLPEKGLIWALKERMNIDKIANHFNVSKQMTQWRYNSTGMHKRMNSFP